ncbi:SCO6745 family protein [Streptomyces pactum]|uniref:SCO6745 family protein n=1 Tax=Streptomyces pactum TaxID=68249 RepID=UPI0036FC234A
MTTLPAHAARRCQRVLNPLHSAIYFTGDYREEVAKFGVTDWMAAYLANRASALGRVGPGTVTAVFHNFKHEVVARHLPGLWSSITPEEALEARLRAADSMLRRILGDEVVGSPEMAEAAGLALRATEACVREARPLYSAHADLPVPDAPHLALWHAATLLREHRGDVHTVTLVHAGLDPVESLVSHTAGGRGMSPEWVLRTRGWSPEEWSAAEDRLRGRGLLDAAGELTEAGRELRESLEDATDRLDAAPFEHLGAVGVARLTELAGAFAARAAEAGAFPANLIGKR